MVGTRSASASRSAGKRCVTATQRHSTRQPAVSALTRLETVRRSLQACGALTDTVALVDSSRRLATHTVYSHHWEQWLQWCTANGTDPVRPSVVALANFLSELSVQKQLALSTVDSYRSAMTTTVSQLGGRIRDTSRHKSLLRDVFRGAALREAKSPRRVPAWDLFQVLAFLRKAPCEPLREASLKWPTIKTVFLIMLATGRRGSEVHSLSGSDSVVAFEPDGKVFPSFLA